VDKVELSVLGGTWSAYPEAYQVWFVLRCLDALEDFGAGVDRRALAGTVPSRWAATSERVDGRSGGPGAYNRIVGSALGRELGGWLHPGRTRAGGFGRAQLANESSGALRRAPRRVPTR
jgi:histone acetyltransferase (RNA polymerase elongator complex component)